MPDATPKVAFLAGGSWAGDPLAWSDGAIRVWGEPTGGVIELAAGFTPSLCELRVPQHEYTKLAGDYDRTGSIEIYWSDPDTPAVKLDGWRIWHVRDSMSGTLPGVGTGVVEKIITLVDRRWELLDGRGGAAWLGAVNTVGEDGLVTNNAASAVLAPGGVADLPDCVEYLLENMHLASGGTRLTSDTTDPILVPLGAAAPRDLKWDGVHIPAELRRLLDAADVAFWVKRNGDYLLGGVGDGSLPALPAGDALPTEAMTLATARPSAVVVTSAPRRAVLQETLAGNLSYDDPVLYAGDNWEYVARDTDGTWKNILDVSWLPADAGGPGGKLDPATLFTTLYAALWGNPAWDLAAADLFCCVRLKADASAGRLPWLSRALLAGDGGDPEAFAPTGSPLLVEAKAWQAGEGGRVYNASDWAVLGGWTADPVNGILRFGEPLLRAAKSGQPRLEDGVAPLAANEFRVTFAHDAQFGDGVSRSRWKDFFCYGYHLAPGLSQMNDTQLDAALGADGSGVRVVSMPELVDLRQSGAAEAELKAAAQAVAARMLKSAAASRVYRYRGMHAVDPSGVAAAVRWNLAAGVTEIDYKAHDLARSRYLDRKAVQRAADAAGGGAGGAAGIASGRRAADGTRDFAALPLGMPSSRKGATLAPAGPAYGKAIADWGPSAPGGPNTIQVNPCDADGSNVNDGADLPDEIVVDVAVCFPGGDPDDGPRMVRVSEGDVVAYWPLGGGYGVMVSPYYGPPVDGANDDNELLVFDGGNGGQWVIKALDDIAGDGIEGIEPIGGGGKSKLNAAVSDPLVLYDPGAGKHRITIQHTARLQVVGGELDIVPGASPGNLVGSASDPPTQADVNAVADKLNALIDALEASGQIE